MRRNHYGTECAPSPFNVLDYSMHYQYKTYRNAEYHEINKREKMPRPIAKELPVVTQPGSQYRKWLVQNPSKQRGWKS